ncbi:MAG: tryptophan-rich sensory protein, partial [Comamonadaceae bacterium]
VLWSLLYFRLRRPDWALVEVVFLWLSILVLMIALHRHAKLATWLLLPYLVWVTFAGLLNLATVRLNGPFGT